MPDNEQSTIEQVAGFWNAGQPMQAGLLIHEHLPNDVRPKWAANILRLVLTKSELPDRMFSEVLETADRQEKWGNAHRVFSSLRDLTLELDDAEEESSLTETQEQLRFVLALAELVAKVTYNATDPMDEFDEDSAGWIASSLRAFVDFWCDREFADASWSALCFED